MTVLSDFVHSHISSTFSPCGERERAMLTFNSLTIGTFYVMLTLSARAFPLVCVRAPARRHSWERKRERARVRNVHFSLYPTENVSNANDVRSPSKHEMPPRRFACINIQCYMPKVAVHCICWNYSIGSHIAVGCREVWKYIEQNKIIIKIRIFLVIWWNFLDCECRLISIFEFIDWIDFLDKP